MRKIIFAVSLLFILWNISFASQPLHSLYFMSELSQRHQFNPSFAPEYGYIAFPFAGNIQLGATSNMGVSTFIYDNQTELVTFMHPSVDGKQFEKSLSPDNYLNQDLNLGLFSWGFFTKKKAFWSFDFSLRERFDVHLPVDLFRLAKFGMAESVNAYDLKNLAMENMNWAESALGYSRGIGEKWRIGAKVKLLVGLSSAKIRYSRFDVNLDQSRWAVNATGESLIVSEGVSFNKDAQGNFNFTDYTIDVNKLKPSGYGAAVDLGFTYKPTRRLTLAAGMSDLGSLKWNAAAMQRGIAQGEATFTGFSEIEDGTWEEQLQEFEDDAKELIKFKETDVTADYKQTLPTSVNVSAEYSFLNNPNRDVLLGLLYQTTVAQGISEHELIGALTLKPTSWLTISSTCSVAQQNPNRFGIALNLSPRWINFFVASDYVVPKLNRQFIPIDAFKLNFQTGISIPLCRNKSSLR